MKIANQIKFGCSRKEGSPLITENDIDFKKEGLRSFKIRGIVFNVLTAFSCPLKALEKFT